MNLRLHRKKSFQANDLIHDQFVVLGKLDNKKHSSTILKGTFSYISHDSFFFRLRQDRPQLRRHQNRNRLLFLPILIHPVDKRRLQRKEQSCHQNLAKTTWRYNPFLFFALTRKTGIGVPNIIWRGLEGPNTITVTECLGPNLKKLFFMMDKNFSVPTIASIGIQVVNYSSFISRLYHPLA